MADLFKRPANYALPLAKGQGLAVDFKNEPGGVPTDYTATFGNDVVVTLIIDEASPITATAAISGEHAVVKIEPFVTDNIDAYLTWRLVITSTIADPPVVPVNGTTVRSDGN
jgi:hypothetical protein